MGETGDLADFSNLASVAERLRIVKDAQRRFLRLWGIEQAMIEPLIDRVAADVEQHADVDAELDDGQPGQSAGLYDGLDGWPPGGPPAGIGR